MRSVEAAGEGAQEESTESDQRVATVSRTVEHSRHEAPPLWLVLAAFAALYIVWGSTYLGIRIAIDSIPPFFMAGSRFVVAGAVLYTFMRMRGAARPTAPHWIAATITGGLLLLKL